MNSQSFKLLLINVYFTLEEVTHIELTKHFNDLTNEVGLQVKMTTFDPKAVNVMISFGAKCNNAELKLGLLE